jgi:hypothetical protein
MSPSVSQSILLAVLLTFACGRNADVLPEPVRLEGVRILEDQMGIRDLAQVDSLLLVSSEQEPLIRVFNKSGAYVGGFGRIGEGPAEFPDTRSLWFSSADSEEGNLRFLMHDQTLNAMRVVDLSASLASGQTVLLREIQLPRELSGGWGSTMSLVNDSLLIGMVEDRFDKRLDEKRSYFYYHVNEGRVELIPLLNLKVDRPDLNGNMNINARGAMTSPDQSKVSMPYVYAPLIDILDVRSKTITTIALDGIPVETTFSLDAFNDETLVEYYSNTFVTNERMYVGFSGQIPAENQDKVIRVMDWSGKVLAQLVIGSEYKLGTFIVDEPSSTIYGLSWELDAIYAFTF